MLYVFAFGTSWVKLGYTCRGPYERRQFGFWQNAHPPALCGRLDECELVALFAGDEPTEKALHAALQPSIGEFYPASRLEAILGLLRCALEPLPVPEDPRLEPIPPRKKPCCGGDHGGFERAEHAARSFATKGRTAPCDRCGIVVSIRKDKLKQHQKSARCK